MDKIEAAWAAGVSHKIQQKIEEWKSFLEFAINQNVKMAMEIGCYDGGSSHSLASFVENLTTLDYNNPARFDINQIPCSYKYIGGNSHDAGVISQICGHIQPKSLDLLFIDGDHSYAGVKLDFNNFKHLVKDGGLICFHDIVDSRYHRSAGCTVALFWNEIKTQYEYKEFVVGNDWGGIGMLINKIG